VPSPLRATNERVEFDPGALPPTSDRSRRRRPDYFVTVNDALVLRLKLPLTPLMVSVYVCREVADRVLIVRLDVPVARFGVNVAVDPDGWPLRLSVTDPLKPFAGLIVTL
jgi:hypothetical protein